MKKLVALFMFIAFFTVTPEANAFLMGKKRVALPRVSGTVTSVDLRKSLVTVTSKDGVSSTLMIEDKTIFVKKGKKISLSDLKKGDPVSIDYLVGKGQKRAHAVNVSELANSKPKLATPKRKK